MTRDELIKRIIRDNSDTYIAQRMRDALGVTRKARRRRGARR